MNGVYTESTGSMRFLYKEEGEGMDKALRNKKTILAFVLPGLIAYTCFVFYPMCQSIYFTFFEGTPNVKFDFVGLSNYIQLFSDKGFQNSFLVTMQYLLVTGTGWIVLGYGTALLLRYGIKRKHTDVARTIVYLPVIIPGVAAAALWAKIFEISPQYGLLNSILKLIGLEEYVRPWIGSSATAMWAVCIAEMWKGIGYYAIILYAGLLDIPKDLEDAARIDGASTWQVVRKIVFPLMRPILIMCIILAIMNSLRVYDMPRILTNGGPGYATTTLSIYMYKVAFKQWKYGYGSTIAVATLILTVIFTSIVNKLDKKEADS